MKVFLGWSGTTSREVASAFHDFLRNVLPTATPFISTQIVKGQLWIEELMSELDQASFGVICLTADNCREPWINFEAGAISKALHRPKAPQLQAQLARFVSPFLFNVDASQIDDPLKLFQSSSYITQSSINNKKDIRELVFSINSQLDAGQQATSERLSEDFDKWWPELETTLGAIVPVVPLTGYPWLFTTEGLAKHQVDEACKCIWYITPHPTRNALELPIRDAIEGNIQRGVSYTFIVPASAENDEITRRLLLMAPLQPSQIRIYDKKSWATFQKMAVTDYIIMNADSEEVEVFLELPVESHASRYWIKVDRDAATGFVARFREFATMATAP